MNNKQRILDLIKKDTLSTEEGLKLLENLGENPDLVEQELNNKYNNFTDENKETFTDALSEINSSFKKFKKGLKSAFSTVKDNTDFVVVKKFAQTYTYPKNVSSEVAMKNFNGSFFVKEATDGILKIDVKGKVYGKETVDALEFFEKEAIIEANGDVIYFKAPDLCDRNEIQVDVYLYLPGKKYKTIYLSTINGIIDTTDLAASNIIFKNKNGNVILNDSLLTDLEIVTLNGNIEVNNVDLVKNASIRTTNGNLDFFGSVEKINLASINGDMKIMNTSSSSEKITVLNANGSIKIAIPERIKTRATLKTTFGDIKVNLDNDNDDVRILSSDKKLFIFRQEGEGDLEIDATTTTGRISVKNGDSKGEDQ